MASVLSVRLALLPLGLRYVCFLALEMRFCVFVRVLVLVWALRLNGSFTGLTVIGVDQYCRLIYQLLTL